MTGENRLINDRLLLLSSPIFPVPLFSSFILDKRGGAFHLLSRFSTACRPFFWTSPLCVEEGSVASQRSCPSDALFFPSPPPLRFFTSPGGCQVAISRCSSFSRLYCSAHGIESAVLGWRGLLFFLALDVFFLRALGELGHRRKDRAFVVVPIFFSYCC